MIRLKVFISSEQKELREERSALGGLLATDPFLSTCMVPRLFEEYPAPLRPNKQGYLELLRDGQVYLLIVGKEYGNVLPDGLSATHQEYRLARERSLPTLVCVKGDIQFERDKKEIAFFQEVRDDGHTYSRFKSLDDLLKAARDRLIKYIDSTFDTEPTPQQNTQAKELIRSASDFERRLVGALTLTCLDTKLLRQLAAAAEDRPTDKLTDNDVREAVVSRGYLWFDAKENVYRPSAAAVLLLAKSPAAAFPQARIQLDAYSGEQKDAYPIDSVLVDAPLPLTIERAVAFVRRNTAQPLRISGLKRTNSEAFPQEALREAIVNAVAHRDYEKAGAKITVEVFADRVVFSSPGLPPDNQKIEQIARGEGRSRARNPLIVQGLTWLELMDERGSGIRRMRESMKRHGLGFPQFALVDDEFTVTLPARRERVELADESIPVEKPVPFLGDKSLSESQVSVLRRALDAGHVQTAWCVQALGISRDTAWRMLNGLHEKGYLQRIGTGRGTRYEPTDLVWQNSDQAQIRRKRR